MELRNESVSDATVTALVSYYLSNLAFTNILVFNFALVYFPSLKQAAKRLASTNI